MYAEFAWVYITDVRTTRMLLVQPLLMLWRVAIVWLLLEHWILGLLGKSPGHFRSAMGSLILWGCSWFINPSFDLHSSIGELRCLHQGALWIHNPHKLLYFLPQSHVARGVSMSFPFERLWWVIYFPSLLQTPWGHFPFVGLFILLLPASIFLECHVIFPKSHLIFQRVLVVYKCYHATCESTCDTLPSSATNQGDNSFGSSRLPPGSRVLKKTNKNETDCILPLYILKN